MVLVEDPLSMHRTTSNKQHIKIVSIEAKLVTLILPTLKMFSSVEIFVKATTQNNLSKSWKFLRKIYMESPL